MYNIMYLVDVKVGLYLMGYGSCDFYNTAVGVATHYMSNVTLGCHAEHCHSSCASFNIDENGL